MAARKLATIWDLPRHTAAKHAILRRYLQAWLPILGRYHGRIVYLDGFAGPGEYSMGEPGSPIIAVQAAIDQQDHLPGEVVFLFVEEDEARLSNLRGKLGSITTPQRFTIDLELGDCNTVISSLLDDLAQSGDRMAPAFAFLDPFGFSDTPMRLIEGLMAHARCEVLITFMFEEINRFLNHEKLPSHFDALFGAERWREALSLPPEARRRMLKELYQRQLREAARIRHVLAFEMRNEADNLDYILFFGTNSIDGLKKMKEAMWKVDPVAGFTFSDATDPDQSVMFSAEPDVADIERRLSARFAGQTIMVDAVERYVLEETPYRETHYKKVLKQMESASPPRLRVVDPAAKRRAYTYPSLTMLQFVRPGTPSSPRPRGG